jgi:hypothetical protein
MEQIGSKSSALSTRTEARRRSARVQFAYRCYSPVLYRQQHGRSLLPDSTKVSTKSVRQGLFIYRVYLPYGGSRRSTVSMRQLCAARQPPLLFLRHLIFRAEEKRETGRVGFTSQLCRTRPPVPGWPVTRKNSSGCGIRPTTIELPGGHAHPTRNQRTPARNIPGPAPAQPRASIRESVVRGNHTNLTGTRKRTTGSGRHFAIAHPIGELHQGAFLNHLPLKTYLK